MPGVASIGFADYLKALPPALVLERFFSAGGTKRRILSSSAIAEATAVFAKPPVLQKRFDALTPKAKFACSLAYLFADTGLSVDSLKGFDDDLLASFLVYAVRDGKGAMSLRGFDEFAGVLRKKAGAALAQATAAKQPNHLPSSWPWHCVNDAAVLFCLAGRGLIKTTKTGTLTKAAHLLCRKVLQGGRSALRLSLDGVIVSLLRFAVERELLIDTGDGYTEHTEHFKAWIAGGREACRNDIVSFFDKDCALWRQELADEFLATAEAWFSLSSFPPSCRTRATNALAAAEFIGIIEIVKEGDEICFSRAPRHAAQPGNDSIPRVVVMPDFSTILPQETTAEALCWFTRMGTLHSLDKVYHGTIDKPTVCNALASGINGDELVAQLGLWQAPHNVVATVREWVREFNRIALIDGMALVSTDSAVTGQIERYEPLARLLTPMAAQAVFRIRRGCEREAAEMLKTIGFDTRVPNQPGTYPPPRSELITGQPPQDPPELVTDFSGPPVGLERPVKNSKYSSELKALENSDLLQVIEYATLMGLTLGLDYAGSSGIRGGLYTARPVRHHRGLTPMLEADDIRTGAPKKFLLDKIKRIGVNQT